MDVVKRLERRPAPILRITYVGLPVYAVAVVVSVTTIVRDRSAAVALVGVVITVVFTVVLGRAAFRPAASELGEIARVAVLAGLAVALVPFGGLSIMYIMTVGAFGATVLPARLAAALLAMVTLGVPAVDVGVGSAGQVVFTDAVVAFVLGLFSFSVRRLAETNLELSAAREEVARLAVADERVRFARDLHDLLGHTLTVIRAKAELAARLSSVGSPAANEMADVEVIAREALGEVRDAVSGYRQASLVAELHNARLALNAAGIEAELPRVCLELPAAADDALGWVLREAVSNVVRHSHAHHCRVETSIEDGVARLAVTNDGAAADPGSRRRDGNGLAGLVERLLHVGGTLEADHLEHGGFRLVATVPTGR